MSVTQQHACKCMEGYTIAFGGGQILVSVHPNNLVDYYFMLYGEITILTLSLHFVVGEFNVTEKCDCNSYSFIHSLNY